MFILEIMIVILKLLLSCFFIIKNIYKILIILFIYRFITSFKLINLQLLNTENIYLRLLYLFIFIKSRITNDI